MTPLNFYKLITISITMTIIYIVWFLTNNLDENNILTGLILQFLISVGSFKTTEILIDLIFSKCNCLKQFVFGQHYLEGTWVGFYLKNNEPVYFIEVMEQSFDYLIIRGKSFTTEGVCRGTWNSDDVHIDVKQAKITYTYSTNLFENNSMNQGIAMFNFERTDLNSAPTALRGFSSDIVSNKKVQSIEVKISDEIECEIECEKDCIKKCEKYLLAEAVKIYNDNKESFLKS